MDADGRVLLAADSPADPHDGRGGVALPRASRRPRQFAARRRADRAHAGERVATAASIAAAVAGAPEGQEGFAVHPRRRVVEGTSGRIGRRRRPARDHEATPSSALAFLVLAAAVALVRRLARTV